MQTAGVQLYAGSHQLGEWMFEQTSKTPYYNQRQMQKANLWFANEFYINLNIKITRVQKIF